MSRPILPNRKILFEHTGARHYWVRVLAFRPPKKGEYYLSGAIVTAYRAPNDLSTPYWVCEPINEPPPEPVHLHEYPEE